MAGFASLEDYAVAFPNPALDPTANQQVQQALDSACDDIRRYCNQTFDLVEGDVVALHGTGKPVLLLAELPLVAVNSVTINKDLPTEFTVTDYRFDRDGQLYRPQILPDPAPDWVWDDCGFDIASSYAMNLGWPKGFANVTVDYDHGYATIPPNLISVAVQLARNTISAPPLVFRGERVSEYAYTRYENYEGVDEFSGVLDRYKINRVAVA